MPNKEWIATIISGHLRSDDVLHELDHFISVQIGGYTQEEADEAMEAFNGIVDSLADKVMSELSDK